MQRIQTHTAVLWVPIRMNFVTNVNETELPEIRDLFEERRRPHCLKELKRLLE